jgi:hypothetical protein
MNSIQQAEYITINDLEKLALGAAVLGSGGGGDPQYFKLMTEYQMEKHGPIRLMQLHDIVENDLVVPISCVGAPLVTLEKLLNEQEFFKLFNAIDRIKNQKPTILMPAEIGGANAFTPLIAAAILGLPVLDADLIGRAFPELQMSSTFLNGVPISPVVVAGALGESAIIESDNDFIVESIARNVSVAMGSSAIAAMYMMKKEIIKNSVIPNSISKAICIGSIILDARKKKIDPIQCLIDHMQGRLVGAGTITDINQEIKSGFLQGDVTVASLSEEYKIFYKNENLLVSCNGVLQATTPDIIILLERQTGLPITSESLAFGLEVAVAVFPAPSIWKTTKGLNLVGPRYFGYDVEYKPFTG